MSDNFALLARTLASFVVIVLVVFIEFSVIHNA